jgi:putative ABC transport system ATP-binding protein
LAGGPLSAILSTVAPAPRLAHQSPSGGGTDAPREQRIQDGMPEPLNQPERAIARLEAVSKTYEMGEIEVHALNEVSFAAHAGEMVAIMGASGSGKSTLLNILGTLDRPSAGRYFLDDEPVEHLDEYALARLRNHKIGFVFQAFNLLARDSALGNVELPMIYAGLRSGERRKRALAALERVGLGDRVDHLPNQLSGGQQQRVSIARAIVNEPLLLLADEPTGALDTATTRQVMELFCDLHAQGMTIVVVTHDPNIAEYAQRVVRFQDGVIVSDTTRAPSARGGIAR